MLGLSLSETNSQFAPENFSPLKPVGDSELGNQPFFFVARNVSFRGFYPLEH